MAESDDKTWYGKLSVRIMQSTLHRNEKLVLMAVLVSVHWDTWSGNVPSQTIIERSGLQKDTYQAVVRTLVKSGFLTVLRVMGAFPLWRVDTDAVLQLNSPPIDGSIGGRKRPSAETSRQRKKPADREPVESADREPTLPADREPTEPAASYVPSGSVPREDREQILVNKTPTHQVCDVGSTAHVSETLFGDMASSATSKPRSRSGKPKAAPKEASTATPVEKPKPPSPFDAMPERVWGSLWYGTECKYKEGPNPELYAEVCDLLIAFSHQHKLPAILDRFGYNMVRSTVSDFLDGGGTSAELLKVAGGEADEWQKVRGLYTFQKVFGSVGEVQRNLQRLEALEPKFSTRDGLGRLQHGVDPMKIWDGTEYNDRPARN